MNQKERMLAELPYKAWMDGLAEEQIETKRKIYDYNLCRPDESGKIDKSIREILGKAGKNVMILAPFHCDYGKHIEVGDNFMANYNCVILDVAKVTIGDNVLFGPNVSLLTAGHPVHHESRNSGYEYGIGITIGNNVWIGGQTVVNPGVTIGDNTVIGSGSVVTKDIPANVVAVGNPCKVMRVITEADHEYYYKNRKFDVSDY
ncbi:sugar O-acetyltransferase [Mucilaginibacter ginsenosidivorans]|uniref:Acetyltransferase n=1 Tax=Mucilaginibacter ginsenosidivorans TaxID=398053 RepID=A0A5B8UWS9_9SPHI|nr:sugar O-acetyltransferase [Mucilaginibacter ginsenosidivorans]QEC63617.1 sugar O-acetyltransferase [Mucilaginibacter ginsenosidivorans]